MHKLFYLMLILVTTKAVSVAPDLTLEKQTIAITKELRCVVCQNETIADSQADLAIDLKNEIKEKLERGESKEEVVNFMIERYGDFILYRPPLKSTTLLLWFGPFMFILFGIAFLYIRIKTNKKTMIS